MNRRELGYALLLSVPVGVGVSMGVLKVSRSGLLDPMVVGAGALAAVAVFVAVAIGVATGSPDEDLSPDRL